MSTLNRDEPFPEDVLRGPVDPEIFTGSIGFRESILEQIRQTRPTVREYLRQTRDSGSGHGGFVDTPSSRPTGSSSGIANTLATVSICSPMCCSTAWR
ncbi:hypothetical protein [Nocardia testacea]|uniref:hypothetical protein n=1 Tax=Nocardia testacea TaxID=248551 RepID=UPI003A8800D0